MFLFISWFMAVCCFCPGVTRTTWRRWTRGPSGKAGQPLFEQLLLTSSRTSAVTFTFHFMIRLNKRMELYHPGLYRAAQRRVCLVIDPCVNIWQWAKVFPIITVIRQRRDEPSAKDLTAGSPNGLYPVFKYRPGSAYSVVSFSNKTCC